MRTIKVSVLVGEEKSEGLYEGKRVHGWRYRMRKTKKNRYTGGIRISGE